MILIVSQLSQVSEMTTFFEKLNIMDWIIFSLLLGGVVLGYIRGFISQLVSIAGLFIAYIAAYLFYDDLAPWIAKWIPLTEWQTYEQYQFIFNRLNVDTYFYNAVSFAILFFGIKIGFSFLGHFFNFIAKVPGLNLLNKCSGALLAFIEVVLIVIVAVNVMKIIPSDEIQSLNESSYIAEAIDEKLPNVVERLHSLWDKNM